MRILIYLLCDLPGNEDSVSLGSSLVSLAERGTITPARQRTVTEVVFPEQIASALNSGLRSRLSSSTSLFRAGSQRSVAADVPYGYGRRDSQRSITDLVKQPLYVSVGGPSNPTSEAGGPTGPGLSPTDGWRSEQGSPRRPASLVLSESMNPYEWLMKPAPVRATPDSPLSEHRSKALRADGTRTAASSSPIVPPKRFSTTNVELLPDQVAYLLE